MWTSVQSGFSYLLWTLIFWLCGPSIFLCILCPLYLYRRFVILLQKIGHPDSQWLEIMNGYDAVVTENMNKPYLTSVMTTVQIFRGSVDLDKIRRDFLEKVILYQNEKGDFPYKKFTMYFEDWWGFPFWKIAKNFDINKHIRLIKGEELKNGNEGSCPNLSEVTEEKLFNAMGDLATSHFPKRMSPWEILVVPNYQPKKGLDENPENKDCPRFALVWRHHHTLFDGVSMVKMVVENLGGEKFPPEQISESERNSTGFFRNLRKNIFSVGLEHARFFLIDRDKNEWHVPLEKLSGRWHTVLLDPVPFSIVRNSSKINGVSTTAVIFGSIAGGIEKYWKNSYHKHGPGHHGPVELPEIMRVRFPVPVPNHPREGLVNHWTVGLLTLPIKSVDRISRFRKLDQEFQNLKNSGILNLTWSESPWFSTLPNFMRDVTTQNRKTTLTASSFPGPSRELTLYGQWPLEDWIFCLARLPGNPSVQIAIMTYNGRIRIALTLDRVILPNYQQVKELGNCIQDELLQLKAN